MDPVIREIRSFRWNYADGDPAARVEIRRRLVSTARRRGLITYSDLAAGIPFNLPNVNHGAPIWLGVPEWTDLHRAIIGEFLGHISCETYEHAGFLLSAVAVSRSTGEPSEGFAAFVCDLGLIDSRRRDDVIDLWSAHAGRAYEWYTTHDERDEA